MPRKLAKALAAAAVALAATAFAEPAAAQTMPRPSGLPWASGVSNASIAAFGEWRGRPLDFYAVFFRKDTWDGMRANGKAVPPPGVPTRIIGWPMLPDSHRGQLPQCAAGAFDASIRVVVNQLVAGGWGGSWLRLGWEANRIEGGGTGHAFNWAALASDAGASYVGCFRRWVNILNPVVDGVRQKRFTIVWSMGKVGSFPHPIDRMYPGGEYVHAIGTGGYDRCPSVRNETEFVAQANRRDSWGNPDGLFTWREYARAKGKPLGLGEWGVGGAGSPCERPGFDNPWYIARMFRFLTENAGTGPGMMAFDSYFDGHDNLGTYAIWDSPMGINPLAAAEYRRLW